MLQGLLLVMSSFSIEINKGNLDFGAPILGNTQTLNLVPSHRSCFTVATCVHPWPRGLLVPSMSAREMPPLCCQPAYLLKGTSAA